MELAAKDNKTDTIRDKHESFIEMYKNTADMFAKIQSTEQAEEPSEADAAEVKSEGKEIDAKEWEKLKAEIEDDLSSYEADSFMEIIESLEGKLINGEDAKKLLAGVTEKAESFEFEEAIAELRKIGGKA